MTAGSTYAFAQQLTCHPIRPGDTAARLALRYTGNANDRREPWFRIVDPATARSIPKSRYDDIQPGWRVCVDSDRVIDAVAVQPAAIVTSAPALLPGTSTPFYASLDAGAWWWTMPLLVVCSAVGLAVGKRHIRERRARLDLMRVFADRFVAEFDRPLFRRTTPPIESRLRFAPTRRRLEILLAPAAGRTYPNLFDHRRNVEYDVDRVVRLLKDNAFIPGALYGEGRWVVVRFHLQS